jgi:C_GCAxxG_C_C family probable redox protein
MTENEIVEKAAARFAEGYSCSQSVLLILSEHLGIQDTALLTKAATGFAAGMGSCGSVCGALTGAIMAAGLKLGTDTPGREKRAPCTKFARALYLEFEKQHGTLSCRELTHVDFANPQEAAQARENKVHEKICTPLVKSAIKIFLALETQLPP